MTLSFAYDDHGLIVRKTNLDGGDSAASEARFFIGLYLRKHLAVSPGKADLSTSLNLLQIEKGVFVRNPTHYNNPKDFSRDQTTPLLVELGFFGNKNLVQIMLKKQISNYFRFQNGDIGTFEDLNVYIRSLRMWYLYPLLFIGDSLSVVNSLILTFWTTRNPGFVTRWLYKLTGWNWLIYNAPKNDYGVPQDPRGPSSTSNDLNRTISLIQAYKVYSTPLSWLSRWIYKTSRPNGINSAWQSYYKGDNSFPELYEPIINEIFYGKTK